MTSDWLNVFLGSQLKKLASIHSRFFEHRGSFYHNGKITNKKGRSG